MALDILRKSLYYCCLIHKLHNILAIARQPGTAGCQRLSPGGHERLADFLQPKRPRGRHDSVVCVVLGILRAALPNFSGCPRNVRNTHSIVRLQESLITQRSTASSVLRRSEEWPRNFPQGRPVSTAPRRGGWKAVVQGGARVGREPLGPIPRSARRPVPRPAAYTSCPRTTVQASEARY